MFLAKLPRSVLSGVREKSKEEIREHLSNYIDGLNQSPVIFKWPHKIEESPCGAVLL